MQHSVVSVDALTGRFSSAPGAGAAGRAAAFLPTGDDITRVTPFRRWDVDAELPGAVSQKLGARFGRWESDGFQVPLAWAVRLQNQQCHSVRCTAAWVELAAVMFLCVFGWGGGALAMRRMLTAPYMWPPNQAGPTTCSCRFLEGVEAFDAAAYSIAPSEALVMDPQQRLMLEVPLWRPTTTTHPLLPNALPSPARSFVLLLWRPHHPSLPLQFYARLWC